MIAFDPDDPTDRDLLTIRSASYAASVIQRSKRPALERRTGVSDLYYGLYIRLGGQPVFLLDPPRYDFESLAHSVYMAAVKWSGPGSSDLSREYFVLAFRRVWRYFASHGQR